MTTLFFFDMMRSLTAMENGVLNLLISILCLEDRC